MFVLCLKFLNRAPVSYRPKNLTKISKITVVVAGPVTQGGECSLIHFVLRGISSPWPQYKEPAGDVDSADDEDREDMPVDLQQNIFVKQ